MNDCKCVAEMNEALAPHNGRIAMGLRVTEDLNLQTQLLIATEKLDPKKRKPVPLVIAAYCPFCGVKRGGAA